MTTPSENPRLDRDAPSVPRDEPGPDAGRPAGRATAEPAPEKEREAPARLSLTQVVASALAAVSTTVLLSYFGTAGTIIGAGIASALTVVANYVYTRSIQKTREQLVPVVGKVVQATASTGTTRTRTTTAVASVPRGAVEPDARADTVETAVATAVGSGETDDEAAGADDSEGGQNRWLRLIDRYGRGRVLTVTALALFVAVMGVVLVVELVLGKPLADAVRGVEGSGTTISHQRTPSTEDPATPAPSAPSQDPATVPTPGPSPSPSTTPSDEPSTTPTPTPEPTVDPTPGPTTPEEPAPTPSPGPGEGAGGAGGTGGGAESEAETGAGDGSTGTAPTPSTPGSTPAPTPASA
ncbi:hypothetical protein G8C93_04255 [Cellulosimicrobium cellulans]|uniref:hypothetical protein n=1 Tax=Cellulosimicrobium cellulans TaxID=1710 RepID=UPI001883BDF9|nr:hypothetical protein [Cellulosimicrobium cellulans]MBE9925106.1 hypothetical protein [Cellulosimicrobium cellulans]